jgi:hypothetical protein
MVYNQKIGNNIAIDKPCVICMCPVKWNTISYAADELKQDNVFYNLVAWELKKIYFRRWACMAAN